MKIVYLGNYNPTEKLNSTEKVAIRLFSQTSLLESDVTFLEYYFKEYPDHNIINKFIGRKTISTNPRVLRGGLLYILYYLIKTQPDIIHIVTYKRYIIVVLLLKFLFNSKIVVTFHGIVKYEITKMRRKESKYGIMKDLFMELLFIHRADCLVFLSANQLEIAKQYYKIQMQKVNILPNGIDENFCNDQKRFNEKGNRKIVFYNGYAYEVKGIKTLINVLSSIKKSDYELFILGDKPFIEEKINIKINYISYIDSKELSGFLKDKDIYINTAEYEPFSIFAAEAMASGLIVIVSSKVGMQNYIKHNYNGFIYNYSKPEELRDILHKVLEGNEELQKISCNASKIFEELNWNKVNNKYLEIYQSLIDVN
jgi:glycosyltransferase involved in cell wall biosynthesis